MSESGDTEQLFQRGTAALRAGDRANARALLIQAIRNEPNNARAWLWLAAAVDTSAQRRDCLERALRLDPTLTAAQRALEEMDAAAASSPRSDPPVRAPHVDAMPAPASSPRSDPPVRAPHAAPLHMAPTDPSPIPHPPSPIPHPAYFNPWLAIWRQPAAALRSAIHTRNLAETIVLGGLSGVSLVFAWAAIRRIGVELRPVEIAVLALLAGGPLGAALLLLGGLLLSGVGRRLGGRGSSGAVRAALAWAGLPMISGLLLWFVQVGLWPQATFGGGTVTPLAIVLALACALVQLGLAAWSAWLSLIALAEAHRFSRFRAAATWIAAGLALVLGMIAILIGAALLIDLRGG